MPAFDLIPILLSVATLFYAGTFIALLIGLSHASTSHSPATPFASIIVAARNEERHLPGLLDCLLSQQYPQYEVVIVDDRSSDSSAEIVRSRQTANNNLKLISVSAVDPGMPPKKNALTKGIQASGGDILLFTDADCLPPPTWISTMIGGFDENTGMVGGYSPYQHGLFGIESRSALLKFFYAFIGYEEFKMALWSAGSIGLRRGWLCTGRNLAYRRRVWDEVLGFQKIKHSVSGDDDLFLQLVQRTTTWGIRSVVSPAAHVPTRPPGTAAEFLQQRKRHFSAGRFFTLPLKLFFILFHGFNLFLYLALAGFFISPSFAWGLPVFLIKSFVDLAFIFLGSGKFGTPPPLFSFPFMELGLLWYNLIVGPLGILGSFTWKPDPK
jgi:cellulose synthase/poly-beta-1,6-N-acetylglucosamine synthase-like glycosyltransferase